MTIRIGVIGAGGRMGREIIAAIARNSTVTLSGAVEAADNPCVGAHLSGGLVIGSNPLALAHASDVLVDFTLPAALAASLDAACAARCPILVGTTGLRPAEHRALDGAARSIAVLQSANTSMGVAVLAALVETAAARLAAWDAEILELHHAAKLDAPSGTAVTLGAAIARGRGQSTDTPVASRAGPRAEGSTGYASLRGGSSAGEHTVMFLGPSERIELAHRAEHRSVFADGAVAAARWLAGRPAGRYTMANLFAGQPDKAEPSRKQG